MLRELHIQNLAVIQDITVELLPGLNCFTGQTGAGKSLVIGALEILLGLRQATDMLRKGTPEGRVAGVFHIDSKNLREEIANATDLPLADEPELIIARRLYESGRTSASLNGHPITGTMLKHVGEILVDVHGQHDAQYLLKPANQLAVIDEFAGPHCVELRRKFADVFHRRQELMAQQKELTSSRTLRRQQLELYEFQAREIDDAQLVAGEHDQLTSRGRLLGNLEKVKRTAGAAYGTLYEEEGSVLERLKALLGIFGELAEMDDSLLPLAAQIKEATLSLDDAAFTLRRYVDRLDLDPEELAEVNQRLNLLNRMVDKYTGPRTGGPANATGLSGVEEVIEYRKQIGAKIEELRAQDQDFSTIGEEIARLEKELRTIGKSLTAERQKAADKLVPQVHKQLADLGMKEARLLVEFTPITLEGSIKPNAPKSKIENQKSKIKCPSAPSWSASSRNPAWRTTSARPTPARTPARASSPTSANSSTSPPSTTCKTREAASSAILNKSPSFPTSTRSKIAAEPSRS